MSLPMNFMGNNVTKKSYLKRHWEDVAALVFSVLHTLGILAGSEHIDRVPIFSFVWKIVGLLQVLTTLHEYHKLDLKASFLVFLPKL